MSHDLRSSGASRIAELERRLELVGVEFERLEAELERDRGARRRAERERDRYRAALARIASAESGVWGTIAHEALHPKEPGAAA